MRYRSHPKKPAVANGFIEERSRALRESKPIVDPATKNDDDDHDETHDEACDPPPPRRGARLGPGRGDDSTSRFAQRGPFPASQGWIVSREPRYAGLHLESFDE